MEKRHFKFSLLYKNKRMIRCPVCGRIGKSGIHLTADSFPPGYVLSQEFVKIPVVAFFNNVKHFMDYHILKIFGVPLYQF